MHAFGTCLLARQRLFRQVICMGRIERNGKVWLKSMTEGYLESNHGPHASVTCKFYDFLRRSGIDTCLESQITKQSNKNPWRCKKKLQCSRDVLKVRWFCYNESQCYTGILADNTVGKYLQRGIKDSVVANDDVIFLKHKCIQQSCIV